MKKTTLLKKLILDEEILVIPGAHDALSAKSIEQVGFKAVTMGGYAASAASLAKPDVSLMTLTEYVHIVRNIVEAVDLPLFVDGDTGHGNVTNVQRTVRLFEILAHVHERFLFTAKTHRERAAEFLILLRQLGFPGFERDVLRPKQLAVILRVADENRVARHRQ